MKNEQRKFAGNPVYDLVLCVGKQHIDISQTTLRHIIRFLKPRTIYIITHQDYFPAFKTICQQHIQLHLVDERDFVDEVNYQDIADFIEANTGSIKRTGWYFQQFLKMHAHQFVSANYYLIWDADTIPLQPIHFFDAYNHILIHPGKEYHQPYFETLNNLLHLTKQVPYSFISEHMMVDKQEMKNLLDTIHFYNPSFCWPLAILKNIEKQHLAHSGFSEYETFGNFLVASKTSNFQIRDNQTYPLQTYRFGSQLFGTAPSLRDLQLLKQLGFHYVTFEAWDKGDIKTINRNKTLAKILNKIQRYPLLSSLKKNILQKIKSQMHQF
ncbi:DUF6492 family protein [Sphingobacterium chuzhouense]|uniref:Mannosyltransferase OCH1 and related enzymes n=1 Tax=Sphingobacterium chuzhouense TaxID=1742264 RepID=A0ABR7XN34_9SPHI|nr:DUF6492 family protein [Sphingobacterium chuzhouense]MBD1420247.1 hypothetical protein [Sphingobacterium chuzhouense]